MNIVVCMDDTDNLESPGTGRLAQKMADALEAKGWGRCSRVTRHQLFVHENIPYTSHNSAMCFEAVVDSASVEDIIGYGEVFLLENSAEGSDPGLCVTVNDKTLDQEKLIQFGISAKKSVLSKKSAYELARELGIHLSEHGGTGDGVIGAVAGTGLRLSGNDGRYRGWYHFGRAGEGVRVETLCSHDFIDSVETHDGLRLDGDEEVILGGEQLKVIYRHRRQVVLVENGTPLNGGGENNGTGKHRNRIDLEGSSIDSSSPWRTLSKEEVKIY